MALLNIIGIIIMGVATVIPLVLFVIGLASHRISIFLFCIFVNFSFGPLDDVSELGEQLANVVKRRSLSIKTDVHIKDKEAELSNKESENKV